MPNEPSQPVDGGEKHTLADAEIVRCVLDGDREAYALLVQRYWSMAEALLSGLGLRGADLDEAVQTAFVTTYRNLHRLRNPAQVGAYLLTVARRSRPRRAKVETSVDNIDAFTAPASNDNQHSDALHEAVARLPESMQVVLGLKFGDQLTAAEIARRLGQSVSSVTKTLSRAYQRLRDDPDLARTVGRNRHE